MGLKIRLRPHEKVIINGCVVENGNRRVTLNVYNYAQILRSRDIMAEADATTPLRQCYFLLQLVLIDPRTHDRCLKWVSGVISRAYGLLRDESLRRRLIATIERARAHDYYKALTELKAVIRFEDDEGVIPAGGLEAFASVLQSLGSPALNER